MENGRLIPHSCHRSFNSYHLSFPCAATSVPKKKSGATFLLERLTPLGVYLVLFTLSVRDEMFYNSKTDCRSRATPAEKKSNQKTESYRHTLYLLFLLIYNKTRTFIFFRFGLCVRCFYAHILIVGFFIFRIILRAVFL